MQRVDRVLTILGSTSVGKSTLTIRLLENRFVAEYDPTIARSYRHRLNTNGIDYDLLIYDTAGLEQHSQINGQYINSDGFILVYSISDIQSFEIVREIFDRLADELNRENIPVVLIGNKSDLSEQRRVPCSEGEQLARKWNAAFLETSAFNGSNVRDVFLSLLNIIDHPGQNSNTSTNNSLNQHQQPTTQMLNSLHHNHNQINHLNQPRIETVNNRNNSNNKSCVIC